MKRDFQIYENKTNADSTFVLVGVTITHYYYMYYFIIQKFDNFRLFFLIKV